LVCGMWGRELEKSRYGPYLRSRRAVLCASLLRLAFAKESYWLSLDWRSILKTELFSNRRFCWVPIEVEHRSPELKRLRRKRPGRSADLVKGLCSPLLCAPAGRLPLAGPRNSSATWHRLVSAACCLGTCSAPARHLLGTCFGAPLARWPAPGLACVPQLHALVLVRLLGAPPTGGTHSASQTRGTEA
jgi:hypothetical protein